LVQTFVQIRHVLVGRRDEAVSHIRETLNEKFHIVPRPAHGFRGHSHSISVVEFMPNAFPKRNKIVPHRDTIAIAVSLQESGHGNAIVTRRRDPPDVNIFLLVKTSII
jgi:hypothetical protein